MLDFVNEAEDIQAAFQPYYQTTLLEEETDPNKLYDHQTELKGYEVFTDADVNEFAEVFFTPNIPLEKLQPVLDRVVIVWDYKPEQDREDFRSTLQKFIRLYGFVSQIITFEDVDLEKLYVFAKALNRKLPRRRCACPTKSAMPWTWIPSACRKPTQAESNWKRSREPSQALAMARLFNTEDEKDLLSHIITTLNETYGINLTEDDKVDIQRIRTKLEADESLRAVLNADNPRDAKVYKFNQVLDQTIARICPHETGLIQETHRAEGQ